MDVAQDAPHTVILTEDEMSMYLEAVKKVRHWRSARRLVIR
jgi:hypothetical protein